MDRLFSSSKSWTKALWVEAMDWSVTTNLRQTVIDLNWCFCRGQRLDVFEVLCL